MVKVKIALVPDEPLNEMDQKSYGRYTSDLNRVNVNMCPYSDWEYSVLLIPDDLEEIADEMMQQWLGLLIGTLKQNIKEPIELELSSLKEWAHFGMDDEPDLFDCWIMMDRILKAVVDSGRIPGLSYKPIPSVDVPNIPVHVKNDQITVKDLLSGRVPKIDLGDDDPEDEDDWDDDDEDDEDDTDDEDDDYRAANRILRQITRDDVKRKKFGSSKVLAHAKNPKRDLNRHGVIIADRRDDLDRDRKMIKAFLKEFIPGNQYWKKELRRTLAQRWIRVYAVSKKTHKELEKEFRRSKHARTAESVLSITHGLFTTPLDSWDDPNR